MQPALRTKDMGGKAGGKPVLTQPDFGKVEGGRDGWDRFVTGTQLS